MAEKELQIADIQDVLKFEFEKDGLSSVFLTSKLSEYLAGNKFSPYVTLELENAKKFSADAVFFRYLDNGRSCIPQIYIYDNITNPRSDEDYAIIHRDIWSASVIPLYFVIDRHQLRVFDGRIPVKVEDGRLLSNPIQIFNDMDEAVRLYNAELFSTGAFWNSQEESGNFLYNNTINQKLLSSLQQTRKFFKKCYPSKQKLIDHVLIISILIKYLEENGIDKDGDNLAGKFFENAVGQNSLVAAMENGTFVDLLDKLSSHFNGGVFKLSEADKTELRNTDLTLLAKWLDGKLDKNNQYMLWQEYSFKHIPIELISFFYEEFLPKDENTQKKKDTGAVYTPSHLVKLLIDECLPILNGELKSLIDVSCGSGIFLVTAFKRLVQIWRYQNRKGGQLPGMDACTLQQLLRRYIYGVDIDPVAAELTTFSLNLSLCSMLSPEQIWTELRFDDLSKENIVNCDFFHYLVDSDKQFDLVIGNPPFKEYSKGEYNRIKRLLQESNLGFEVEIPRYQSALMFLDKAMSMLEPQKGKLCLILPAGPFLYSKLEPFRSYFFKKYNVRQIIDFTFLSNMLFKANVATVALFAENQEPDAQEITHIIAKRTGSSREKIFFEFDYYDFYDVPKEIAQTSEIVWKCNLLGGSRVYDIMEKYQANPTIKGFLDLKVKQSGWYYSKGYTVGSKENKAEYITGKPSVVDKSFTDDGTWKIEIENSECFDRPREKKLYEPPVLLIKENIGHQSIPVGISHEYITFKQGIIGIHSSQEDYGSLEGLFDYIKINNDFLRFYIVARSTRAGISKSIHTHLACDFYSLPYSESGFELTKNEQMVVEDVVKYIFPYFDTTVNPELDSVISYQGQKRVLAVYGSVYCDRLNVIYEKDGKKYIPAGIYEGDCYFIYVIDYTSEEKELQKYESKVDLENLLTYKTEEYVVKRIVRKYDNNRIVIVKPKQFRYWIKSIALRDADDTFADITEYYV